MDPQPTPALREREEIIDPAEAHLNPEQRELLRSLERAFEQAERGETRPFALLLEELRMEREAEESANNSHATF